MAHPIDARSIGSLNGNRHQPLASCQRIEVELASGARELDALDFATNAEHAREGGHGGQLRQRGCARTLRAERREVETVEVPPKHGGEVRIEGSPGVGELEVVLVLPVHHAVELLLFWPVLVDQQQVPVALV